jgi:hypothetical protein
MPSAKSQDGPFAPFACIVEDCLRFLARHFQPQPLLSQAAAAEIG